MVDMKNQLFHHETRVTLTTKIILSDMTECSSIQCQNQGQCVNGNNGYVCECQAGWAGDTCEIGMVQLKLELKKIYGALQIY